MLGLETTVDRRRDDGEYRATRLAAWPVMSERPAQIVGLTDQGRPIAVGEPANLAVVVTPNPHGR